MKLIKILVFIILYFVNSPHQFPRSNTFAQDSLYMLQTGKTIERKISSGEIHRYLISLKAEQFVFAKLDQQGIDVVITVFDPAGGKTAEFDAPTGNVGPEYITFVSKTTGDYTIEIHPFEDKTDPGNYILELEKIERAALNQGGKIDQLFSPWDREGTPGAAVGVLKDGILIFKNGYGSANLEYDIPITPSTIFHMASVSKQFTAFSIVLLAERGKLSLDDDIRLYLPELPDLGRTITIRHLIHHTSGLRDQWNLLVMAGWRMDDVITKDHIMKLVRNQKELNFNPGDEYLYCNTGYTLLAEIVSRISGKSFAEWTKENIFDPLNMKNTVFFDDHETIVKNRAYSYLPGKDKEFKKSVLSYANAGATSLFTNVEDLSKWAHNFEDPVVGNHRLIKQMEEKGVLNNGDTLEYAFGQGVGKYKGLKFIGHSGGDAGFRTYLGRFPEQGLAVMVLSNLGSFNPGGMALKIADIYLANEIETEKFLNESAEKEEIEETEQSRENLISNSDLNEYTGDYYSEELETNYKIVLEGDKLIVRHLKHNDIILIPDSKDKFRSETWFFSDIKFTRNALNLVNGCLISSGRVRNLKFEKVD